MSLEHKQSEHENNHDHVIFFYINGEMYETASHKLTVRQILELGGFLPVDNFRLTRENGDKTITDMNQDLSIHNAERFTATFNGPTPVS